MKTTLRYPNVSVPLLSEICLCLNFFKFSEHRLRKILVVLGSLTSYLNLCSASVPVYVTPQHIVPTGHYAVETLLRSSSESRGENWLKIKDSDHAEYWVKREDVIRPIELSRKAFIERDFEAPWSKELNAINKNSELVLLEFKRGYVSVIESQTKRKFTVHEAHLKPNPKDLGYVILEKKSRIYSSQNMDQPEGWADAGSKWLLIQINSKHLKVQSSTHNKKYYIKNEDQFLSRFDFSDLVKTQRGIVAGDKIQWNKDSIYEIHIKKSWLFSQNTTVVGLRKPVSHSSAVTTLKPYSPVIMLDETYSRWVKSHIKGDEVWWNLDQKNEVSSVKLNDLLKKDIYSLAQNPKLSQEILLSSNGVFFSEQGHSFTFIDRFQTQNLPVDIDYNGNLYVGEWISKDKGHTFQPYIRWESLIETLKKNKMKKLNRLSLNEIQAPKNTNSPLRVAFSVDNRKIQTLSRDNGKTWSLLNEQR